MTRAWCNASAHFNPYGDAAAQVAAGPVNLGPAPADELARTLRANGMSISSISAEDASAVGDWAHRLREVFAEDDPDARVDLANQLLADSACRPYVSRHDGVLSRCRWQ